MRRKGDAVGCDRAVARRLYAASGIVALLSACGGGGGASTDPPAAAEPNATSQAVSAPAPLKDGRLASSSCGTSSSASGVFYADLRGAALGVGAALNGAQPFPANNAWNQDISRCPADPASEQLIAKIGLNTGLHPDFGAGLYNGAPIGIPYVVVSGAQARVPIQWTAYGDESDPGPYPVPANAPIEGGPSSSGDRHVIVIDRDSQRIYELGEAYPQGNGSWNAAAGAIFHADSNNVRPTAQARWTSTDAAGLPIFPGLARYEEAAKGPGGIRHALRFTVASTRVAYVPPASHWAPVSPSTFSAPMGMRVRLKASYVIPASFSTETRALLTAMKTYGLIVADNGSNWYISGSPDDRWNNDKLVSELAQVKGSNFEVVRMDGLVVGP